MGTNYVKFNINTLKRIQKKSNPIWNKTFLINFVSENDVKWSAGDFLEAYYEDIIVVDNNTIYCYKWDEPTTIRWSNTVSLHADTEQYKYSDLLITGLSGSEKVSKAINIKGSCTRETQVYTITWKCLLSYPDNWTQRTQAYAYGVKPNREAPGNVESGNVRKVFDTWDNLAPVTGDRTITAKYIHQGQFIANLTRCSLDSSLQNNAWYDYGSTHKVSIKANDKCAFEGTGTTTTLTADVTIPQTITYSADYIYVITSGTNCTPSLATGWHAYQTPCVWTPAEYYSFNAGTTQQTSAVSIVSPGATYTNTPHYVKVKQLVTGNYSSEANINDYVYYPDNTQVQWKAASNYSYRGESTEDWSIDTTAIVPGGIMTAPDPGYVKCTITGDRVTVSPSSGSIIKVGSNITWTATSNYSFAEGITRVATTTQAVNLDTLYYYKSADYKNITVSGVNCAANTLSGYRQLGKTITWTAQSSTDYKYSFSSTNADVNTTTDTINVDTVTYTKTAPYLWYNVTSVTGTNCKAYTSTSYSTSFTPGWYLSGTKIYWQTTSIPYAMTSDNSDTQTVNVAAGNNDKSAIVKQYPFSITKNSNVSSIKVWRTDSPFQGNALSSEDSPLLNTTGTAIVHYGDVLEGKATANTGYHFSTSNLTTSTTYGPVSIVSEKPAWSPTASVNKYKVNVNLDNLPTSVTAGATCWLSLDKNNPNATKYELGSSFDYGTTVYAVLEVLSSNMTGVNTTASGWSQISGGQYSMYVIGQVTTSGVASPIIINPSVVLNNYPATVSQGFGYNSVFLSTDPDATSGSPSGTSFPYGTTVYSFGILNVHASAPLGTLVSGTKNTPGAIYRISSKVISSGTNNFGTVALSRTSMAVLFTGEGSTTGTVNFYATGVVSGSDYCALYYTSGNPVVINCIADDFNGISKTSNLMEISYGSSYSATCTLKNYDNSTIAWNSNFDFASEGILIEVELTPSGGSGQS